VSTDEILDAFMSLLRCGWRGNHSGDHDTLRHHREKAFEHRVRGFADSDYFHFGKALQIVLPPAATENSVRNAQDARDRLCNIQRFKSAQENPTGELLSIHVRAKSSQLLITS
jgi:hypothetical protein